MGLVICEGFGRDMANGACFYQLKWFFRGGVRLLGENGADFGPHSRCLGLGYAEKGGYNGEDGRASEADMAPETRCKFHSRSGGSVRPNRTLEQIPAGTKGA